MKDFKELKNELFEGSIGDFLKETTIKDGYEATTMGLYLSNNKVARLLYINNRLIACIVQSSWIHTPIKKQLILNDTLRIEYLFNSKISGILKEFINYDKAYIKALNLGRELKNSDILNVNLKEVTTLKNGDSADE